MMPMCCASLIILFAGFASVLSADSHWHYGNQDEWPGVCQAGTLQSPINLDSEEAVDTIYSAFEFKNYDVPHTARVKNNGHSVTITLEGPEDAVPSISKGGLLEEYVLDHLHFHWPSEHTVRGYRYPLEMHLVHYDKKYGNLSIAVNYAGAVAVLGILFDISLDDDRDFVPLIEVMNKVEHFPDTEVILDRQITTRSFLPRNTGDYYRYQGSLTTPNCNEGVIWTVFMKTLPISADQITHFQSVWSPEGPLPINYRQVQNLNGRTILKRRIPIKSLDGLNSAPFSQKASLTLLIFTFILSYVR